MHTNLWRVNWTELENGYPWPSTGRSWFAAPVVLLEEVWKDPDWRAPLLNLLVQTAGAEPGFLRDIQPERGLGLVDIDGESQWVRQATEVVIPHPIRVTVLAEYRMPEVAED